MPISPLTGASIEQSAVQPQDMPQFEEETQPHCFPTGKPYSLMLGYSFPFISTAHKTNRWMQHSSGD